MGRIELPDFTKLSGRDVARAARQKVERVPGLGLVSMVPFIKHPLALRDAVITIFFGTAAVWLSPIILMLEQANPVGWQPVFANLLKATSRGDVLILVPSLVAPLYLLLAILKDNRLMRLHQVTLFIFAALISIGMLAIYVTKVADNIADKSFLLTASKWGIGLSSGTLYLFFLLDYLPDNLLSDLQARSTTLKDDVLSLRKQDGE
jgi:hypothetical protein